MVPLAPQSLIAVARALALMGAQDDYTFGDAPPRSQDAPVSAHGSPERWDLRFVHRCGYSAFYDHRPRTSSWPLPMELTHTELAEWARLKRILRDEPAPGDVFLVFHPRTKTFIQAGVIASIDEKGRYDDRTPFFEAYSIVGDTDETGHPGRGRTMRLNKRLLPAQGDVFIRWGDLDVNGDMITYNRSTFLRDAKLLEKVEEPAVAGADGELVACGADANTEVAS
jgi:hypothetical protein